VALASRGGQSHSVGGREKGEEGEGEEDAGTGQVVPSRVGDGGAASKRLSIC